MFRPSRTNNVVAKYLAGSGAAKNRCDSFEIKLLI